jgi:transcriptional regulator with XRE-family HTH domain
MSPLGLRVREVRVQKGWTITELAERAKVRRATVSRIENTRVRAIDFDVLERIADALGVDPALLITRITKARKR